MRTTEEDINSRALDRGWALLFARLVLGLIFFMAGVYKVFQLGPLEHARKYFLPFSDTFLPVWSLWAVGVVIPIVELVAGGLVILGFRTREALVSLGFVLAIVMSTAKQEVEALLSKLPDDCSIEDIQYHLYVIEKVRHGLEEADTQGGVPQEEVELRLGKWLTK